MTIERRLIESESAAARVEAASAWLGARRKEPVVIVGPRDAVDALVWRTVDAHGPALGWQRVSLDGLAGRLAARELARRGLTPVTGTAIEALCARLLHRALGGGAAGLAQLGRFAGIADRPGLPRALASTLGELAHADLGPDALRIAAPDLANLYAAYRADLPANGLADRATVLEHATAAVIRGDAHALLERPVLLLDVRVRSRLEADLIAAIAARAPALVVTVPRGDDRSRALLCERIELTLEDPPVIDIDPAVRALQTRIFERSIEHVPHDHAIEILSAPGESREATEIARRILSEAKRGTRFDRIAVLLRAPELYRVHLVEAFRRAGIPAHFSRGARRPDPTGRALLALLACAAEGLSARAFGEYLSLGVVPDADEGAPPAARGSRARFVPADEDLAPGEDDEDGLAPPAPDAYDEDAPVRAGTLRAPRRWEQLIVDAAVIGGRDRWARRLDGLLAATRRAKSELDEPDGAQAKACDRRLADLEALRGFALPLIDALAALPGRATWGAWIDALASLATRSLRDPRRVLAVLASLAPMADVGPVDLAEVRAVLTPRLREEVAREPIEGGAGQVQVASIEEARGREFDVVFVPGLAEKVFPGKIVEDPILLDAAREQVSDALVTRTARGAEERLALRLALGAARRRIVASIPRLDVERSRPRVPSFYALEIARAVEGELPSYEDLGRRAEIAGAARLGWPAPDRPEHAIDAAEHDLSVLASLLDLPSAQRAGRAAYLVAASPIAARALRTRWARWDRKKWRPQDGLVDPEAPVRAILAEHTIDRRAYSATALESFAQCPYRFYLRTILRLEARDVPAPLEQLDPAQRGSLIHDAQFRLLTRLRREGALPVRSETLEGALVALDEVLAEVEASQREELAPAIPRIWNDGIEAARRDMREWLHRSAEDPSWTPIHFELAFGMPAGDERDVASRRTPVPLSIGVSLRGAIDLVEQRDGSLRATDYKTGGAWVRAGSRINGGESLQPLLYALVLESMFPERIVWGGRLYYCTEKGRYTEVEVPLDDEGRAAITKVTQTIDESVRTGFLPPAPTDKACRFCDYTAICGPHEARRSKRKEGDRLVPVEALRRLP